MLASKLFETPLIIVPGMDEATIEAEWQLMVKRAEMTQAFLDRKIDIETYFDFMIEQGYEPSDLLDQAEENLQFAISEGLELER